MVRIAPDLTRNFAIGFGLGALIVLGEMLFTLAGAAA